MSLETQSVDPVSTGTAIPGEMPSGSAAPVSTPDDISDRARAMGWRPKEEYRGDPERWVDADTFVKRGEEEAPVMRERLRDATRKVSDLDRQIKQRDAEYQENLGRIERAATMALHQQRAQIEAQFRAALKQAVETGDVQRYDQLERSRDETLTNFDENVRRSVAPKPAQQPQAPQLPAHVVEAADKWKQENSWFGTDPLLRHLAMAEHERLNVEMPGLSIDDNLRRVKAEVMKRYPEKFGIDPGETRGAAVEGGRRSSATGVRQRGASDLPSDARRIGEKFVKDGLFKSVEDYAKAYWTQEQGQ